jgi:hypothetical protein
MSSEIRFPFQLGRDGKVAVETNPDSQIAQRVKILLATQPGERVMLPQYGVATMGMLFEPNEPAIQASLQQAVLTALKTFEPGVVVRKVTPVEEPDGSGIANIEVDYVRADAGNNPVAPQHINTAVIKVGGKVDEVIRG